MMKRWLLGLLVGVTALAPALAEAQRRERTHLEDLDRAPDRPRPTREQRREAREERRAERQATRAEPAPEPPRRDRDGDGVRDPRRERRFDREGAPSSRPDGAFPRRADQLFPPARDQRRDLREDGRGDRQEGRDERRERRNDWRNERSDARRDWRDQRREWRDNRQDRRGDWSSWGRNAYRGGQVWSRGWRGDRRYDWPRHREANRGLYRLPRYYAPYGQGYAYRRFGLGAVLARSLYAQGYWIDDPWYYRLPPAYGPYRWVRYYGDALLIDLRTGRVIDVIHDIFY